MKCYKCGYCCTNYLVTIVVDPERGPVKGNLKAIDCLREKCPHLSGERPGHYSCNVHHYPWFKDSPCGEFNEHKYDCNMGQYILKNNPI